MAFFPVWLSEHPFLPLSSCVPGPRGVCVCYRSLGGVFLAAWPRQTLAFPSAEWEFMGEWVSISPWLCPAWEPGNPQHTAYVL